MTRHRRNQIKSNLRLPLLFVLFKLPQLSQVHLIGQEPMHDEDQLPHSNPIYQGILDLLSVYFYVVVAQSQRKVGQKETSEKREQISK